MRTFLVEAAQLVAGQDGAAQRLRSGHRPRHDGTCRGCGDASRTHWPCVLITIADLADTVAQNRGEHMADPPKPDPKPGKHEDDRDGKGVPNPDKWKDPNKK